MPYTLSVLRKMLKHVFNSEIKFRLVSDNLCGIQYLRNPVSYAAVIWAVGQRYKRREAFRDSPPMLICTPLRNLEINFRCFIL